MFAQREGGESREAEASSPGDGRCASGTVTLREMREEEAELRVSRVSGVPTSLLSLPLRQIMEEGETG